MKRIRIFWKVSSMHRKNLHIFYRYKNYTNGIDIKKGLIGGNYNCSLSFHNIVYDGYFINY